MAICRLNHTLHELRLKLGSPPSLKAGRCWIQCKSKQVQHPHGFGHKKEVRIKLGPGVGTGNDLVVLVFMAKERLFHVFGHEGEVLCGSETAKLAGGQDTQHLGGVHGAHVTELGKAGSAESRGVEEGGEGTIEVEGFVLKALEEGGAEMGLEGIVCEARGEMSMGMRCRGKGGEGGGDVAAGCLHEGEQVGCEGVGGGFDLAHAGVEQVGKWG